MKKFEQINDWQWFDFDELGSTNDEALAYSKKANGEKLVITTTSQTNGRGRRGRSWVGLEGNLFMSMAIPFDIRDNGALVFMVSLALLLSIKELNSKLDILLKWPNDVLLQGGKVSGILLEKGEGEYMVVGVGVNIKAFPNTFDMLYQPNSLLAAGIKIDRIDFMKIYLQHFDKLIFLWQEQGINIIINEWLKYAKGVNEKIIVRTPKEEKSGIFIGIDNQGRLLLQGMNNIEAISVGDVFFE